MIRIRVDDQPAATTFHVEGKLVGDEVEELRKVWAESRNRNPGRPAVVDLSSVLVVDPTARKLLSQMHQWGVQLTGTGIMIAALIEEIVFR